MEKAMSVVLRIYGQDLDIDAVLGCCDLHACAVQRRGEKIILGSDRGFSQSAIFISISESDIGGIGHKVDETLSFLDQNQSAVAALVDTPRWPKHSSILVSLNVMLPNSQQFFPPDLFKLLVD